MAFTRQCDRCKENFPVSDVKQLDYYAAGLGHYHTVHLCNEKCAKDFEKLFMKGLTVSL
jgi:hypothetical protein